MKLPPSTKIGEGLHPALWPAPRLAYPAGLPSQSWIPANRWQPPTREQRELTYDQRRALRHVRAGIRAGLTLEQIQPQRGCKQYRAAFEGWKMAHRIAQAARISPWDALDFELARTLAEVERYSTDIETATSTEELLGRGRLAGHVRDRRWEREHLVKTAKLLIDAGLAAHVVAQIDADGAAIAGVLKRTLGRLGLSEADSEAAAGILREELLALDGAEVIEGVWSEETTK